jgi:uncharacterized repeat protein (TIGR03803 family)
VLYDFGAKSGDPLSPRYQGIVSQGRDGNLYSSAPYGGANGLGAVFKITPTGKLSVLYSFNSPRSTPPIGFGGLILGTDGNFYGTTWGDGAFGLGTVFKVTPKGKLTVLHDFAGGRDGGNPYASPIQGTDGNFYGTTGLADGTVYKITPSGTFTTIYQFPSGSCNPSSECIEAPLVQGTDGNFYSTSTDNGAYGWGTVYKITPGGQATDLHDFDGPSGALPVDGLVQGADGDFYGVAFEGGPNSCGLPGPGTCGVVFKITPAGKVTVLHNFNGTDGCAPAPALLLATDGNFYGTAAGCSMFGYGNIFRITPKGTFSVVYAFDGTTGASPTVPLVQHTNGIVYGDTGSGGLPTGCNGSGCGVFFSLNLGLGPFARIVSTSGKAGKTVEILGQGLTGTTAVAFNGTSASFNVVSDTYLTASVPSGATTGFVTVTTPGGTLTSNTKFRVRR